MIQHGHGIAAILSMPDEPTTRLGVLCHGFLSGKNSTTNKTLTRLLNERGIATFRFDFLAKETVTDRSRNSRRPSPCIKHTPHWTW